MKKYQTAGNRHCSRPRLAAIGCANRDTAAPSLHEEETTGHFQRCGSDVTSVPGSWECTDVLDETDACRSWFSSKEEWALANNGEIQGVAVD